jgi:hypothetical protein
VKHETHQIARAILGDTAPLERAREFLDRYHLALRRGIPERALLVVLHGAVERGEAWSAVTPWLTGGGLYVLSGPRGTGKTVAAVRWAASTSAHWVAASVAWEADRQDELRSARALVIDEVGGHGSTSDVAVQRLGALLSGRHADRLATMLTMNLDRVAFGNLIDGDHRRSRILDRLDEEGGWQTITQRMRPKDSPPSWKRIEEATALERLWARVERVASGHELPDVEAFEVKDGPDYPGGAQERAALSACDELRRVIGFSDEDLAAALVQQAKVHDMMAAYAKQLRGDAERDRDEVSA